MEGALRRGAGHGEQALGAAEGVGDVEHLGHRHEDRARLTHHREGHVDLRQAARLGVTDLAVEGGGELALEVGEHRGEVAGEGVVGLVRQRQQAQLAAQLVVLPVQRGVERDVDPDQADLDGRLAGRLGCVGVVLVDHPLRRALVAHLLRRLEPHDLAVGLDGRAPGQGALGHDREAASEGEEQVEVVEVERRRWHRRSRRPVDDLDAGVAGGAAHAHLVGGLAVEDRVGDQLGDAQLGALDEVGSVEPPADVADPAARVSSGARRRRQRQLGAQRHWDSFRGGWVVQWSLITRPSGGSNLDNTIVSRESG